MHAIKTVGRWFFIACLLVACDAANKQDNNASQRFYFIESLNLVESAGVRLQQQLLTAEALKKVLEQMDNGLKLAFEVKAEYLDLFDPRLSKNYQRYFVKGIESYRLGIEAGDAVEQKNGLKLLSQWAAFWAQAGESISASMQVN